MIDINKSKEILEKICVWVNENIALREFVKSEEIIVKYSDTSYFRVWMYDGIFDLSVNHTSGLLRMDRGNVTITDNEYMLSYVYYLPKVWKKIKEKIQIAYDVAKSNNELFEKFEV